MKNANIQRISEIFPEFNCLNMPLTFYADSL